MSLHAYTLFRKTCCQTDFFLFGMAPPARLLGCRWASESQVSRVARRVSVDLHLTLSKLKAVSMLAPSPRLDGTEPVANRDVHSSKWGKALNIGHKGAAG